MKIVPDITANAALDGLSFDATLSLEKARWMEHIRQTWLACKFQSTFFFYFQRFLLILFHCRQKRCDFKQFNETILCKFGKSIYGWLENVCKIAYGNNRKNKFNRIYK